MFKIVNDGRGIDFRTFVGIDLREPVDYDMIFKGKIIIEFHDDLYNTSDIQILDILYKNSGLHIGFSWELHDTQLISTIVDDCIQQINNEGLYTIQDIITDNRGDWMGFIPLDLEHTIRHKISTVGHAIRVNNQTIEFQKLFIEKLYHHPLVKQSALLYDSDYRFWYFKKCRGDRTKLSDAFRLYLDSVINILDMTCVNKDSVEMDIGCHFLHDPELFNELVNFSKLKGEIDG